MSFVKESRTFEGVSIASLIIGVATLVHVLFIEADQTLVMASIVALSIPLALSLVSRINDRRGIVVEVLAAVAAAAAVVTGDFVLAGAILLVSDTCRVATDYAVSRTYAGIRDVLDRLPLASVIIKDGQKVKVPVSEVKAGDTVQVVFGETVPFDGTIKNGSANLDTSVINGHGIEFKKVGDTVHGGCINMFGYFDLDVLGPANDGTVGKLAEMEAMMASGSTEAAKLSDRVLDITFAAATALMAAVYYISGITYDALGVFAVFTLSMTAATILLLAVSGKLSGKDVFSKYSCPCCRKGAHGAHEDSLSE